MPRLTVSFCIPTHGRLGLLLEALESGATQTRLPDEIVVSDDLGSAETRALVSEFARKTPVPVRYVHCTVGQSLADNINNCFREAACDLTLLLHDDDLLMPRAVELLAPPFEENPDMVGSYGKQMIISDGGQEQPGDSEVLNRDYNRNSKHAGLQPDAVRSGIWQQFPNDGYMVKTSVSREVGQNPEYRSASEVDFGIRMGERGQFYYIDEYTAKYRLSAESISRGSGSRQEDFTYQAMRIFLRMLGLNPSYEPDIAMRLKTLSPIAIRMAANTGRLNEAVAWYFGPYHWYRIPTPAGFRTAALLLETWCKEKFAGAPSSASR